jgi:hypothetical protein
VSTNLATSASKSRTRSLVFYACSNPPYGKVRACQTRIRCHFVAEFLIYVSISIDCVMRMKTCSECRKGNTQRGPPPSASTELLDRSRRRLPKRPHRVHHVVHYATTTDYDGPMHSLNSSIPLYALAPLTSNPLGRRPKSNARFDTSNKLVDAIPHAHRVRIHDKVPYINAVRLEPRQVG